jgi:hypothetical protein
MFSFETCGQLTCLLTFCAGSEKCHAEPSCARAMVLPFEEWVSLAHPHVGGFSPSVLAGMQFPSFDDRKTDCVDWLPLGPSSSSLTRSGRLDGSGGFGSIFCGLLQSMRQSIS